MHCIAGALLIAQLTLVWVLDETVEVMGLGYAAWALWIVAMVLLLLPMPTLRSRGGVQKGSSYVETETVVENGVYALVRHPQYLGWMLMYIAVLLFKTNWILAILGIAGAACVVLFTVQEEALLIDRFGECYKRYMQAVPRFNLLAGVIRLLVKHRVEDRGSQ
jgi:protein-S-isoprenylcysteine O-methyltransferase Ste14